MMKWGDWFRIESRESCCFLQESSLLRMQFHGVFFDRPRFEKREDFTTEKSNPFSENYLMYIGRLILTIFATAVVFFLFDMVFHGWILGKSYAATADSWRSIEDMESRRPFQMICYVIIAIGFCTIWAFGFPGKGVKCGVIYGLFLGLFATGGMMMNFVFLPIPDQFKLPWAFGGIAASILGGIVTALIYKPKPGLVSSH
jgi:hypothetical protein